MGRRRKYDTYNDLVDLGFSLLKIAGIAACGIAGAIFNALTEDNSNNNASNNNNNYSNDRNSAKNTYYRQESIKKQKNSKTNLMKKNQNILKTTENNTEHEGLYSNINKENFSESAEFMYEKTKELYAIQDYYQAKRYIEEAIKQDPSNSLYLELNSKIKMAIERK